MLFSLDSLVHVGVPALLIITAGWLIRRRGNPETAGRRFLLFLVWVGGGFLAAMLTENWLLPQPAVGYTTLLAPAVAAVIAMLYLHLPAWPTLRRWEKALTVFALILVAGTAALLVATGLVGEGWRRPERALLLLAIVSISGFLALAWTLGRRRPLPLGLLAAGGLALFNGSGMGELPLPAQAPPGWLPALSVAAYLGLPALVVGAAAALTHAALDPRPATGEHGPAVWAPALGRLALAGLLLAGLAYTLVWVWIWDGTDDGLRGYGLLAISNLAAIAAAIVIGMTAAGWRRWTGLAFAALVIGGVFGIVMNLGNTLTPHTVTEARAARLQAALERFRAKTGRYPADLGALVPGEVWWLPKPMILPDQKWCYEGGPDYFRLGAVYREHWSTPFLEMRVYASAGDPPATLWDCDEQLAELKPKYDLAYQPAPTPIPLPTSVVPVQRITVQPVLRAASLSVGRWSPDGAYLVFGLTRFDGGQVEVDLHFLKGATGEICRASEPRWTAGRNSDGLGDHHAWLPDGRLLYVSEAGRMMAFSPCADDAEDLTTRHAAPFTQVVSSDERNGRVVLRSADAYWLLDGATLEARPVSGISPGSSGAGWTGYAWSPGGERLAISRLDEPAARDGATLYIVDWATAAVERALLLEDASEASLPIVEWLARDELLTLGGALRLMDLRADPPTVTDLVGDVFWLDVAYPADFSSVDVLAASAGGGYYIGARVNHPRHQAAYLYASETGQVQVFGHDVHTLLFFPGGRWMRLPKWEDTSTERDEYELVWMDQPGQTRRLVVEGHLPRSHPQIFPRYLPATSQLVVSSSQGISLISLPEGRTVRFWELASGGYSSDVYPSPREDALVAAVAGDGLYYLPLPPGE